MKKKNVILSVLVFIGILLLISTISNGAGGEAQNNTTLKTSAGITANITYELDTDENIINLKCTNPTELVGKLTIPATIDEKNVISIGKNAFSNAKSLTEVELPSTILNINSSAFSGCSGLAKINIPDGVLTIGDHAFESCTVLPQIKIPNSVIDIDTGAFKYCNSLASVNLSNKLSSIKNDVFYKTGIIKIEIPDGITSIGDNAFYGANNLEILIPDSVISIHEAAFRYANATIYATKDSYAYRYVNEKLYSSGTLTFVESSKWNESAKVGPTVTSISVSSPNSGTYNTTQTVKIRVYFSEKITGTTVPTLTIKFGDSKERTVTNGTISGQYIEYSYNIQAGDNGQLATVDLKGGTIKDSLGNDAILSCPIISGNTIKANTQGIVNNNTDNQDKTNNNNNSNNNNDNSGATSQSPVIGNGSSAEQTPSAGTSSTQKVADDGTTAKTKLPNTGKGIILVMAMILIIITGGISKIKYNTYKDIK